MSVALQQRNADLNDLVELLKDQHDVKRDAVVPASAIRSSGGVLSVEGLGDDQGTEIIRPTEIMDGHIAERLGIPVAYLRKLRVERTDIYDANVNGWLRGTTGVDFQTHEPDPRNMMIRSFLNREGGEGIGRALLSDRYGMVDNLDVLMAALEGINLSGAQVEVHSADLSETRMTVRVFSPEVQALAPVLLAGYRSPYRTDVTGSELPTVFAGFEISNSETGGAAFTITPRLVVEICRNGMKMTKDAIRKVHLGGRLDSGIIKISDDTRQKNLELVRAETRDVVGTFLDGEYVSGAVAQIEEKAGAPVNDPVKVIEHVSKTLAYSEAEQTSILDAFVKGGQSTAGGVLNAVTAAAQIVESADRAFELETSAMRALELAAA